MSSKTINELLKESDPGITDKEIARVGDRMIEFTHWANHVYEDKICFPLPWNVVKTFWDLKNNEDAYCTEDGIQYVPTPKGFDEIFNHIKIHKGQGELNSFVNFVKRVESQYPGAVKAIAPDRFLELFDGEIDAWYMAVFRHGDDNKAILNSTTRTYIEKMFENQKMIDKKRASQKNNV